MASEQNASYLLRLLINTELAKLHQKDIDSHRNSFLLAEKTECIIRADYCTVLYWLFPAEKMSH